MIKRISQERRLLLSSRQDKIDSTPKYKKVNKIKLPLALEREYTRGILEILKKTRAEIEKVVIPALPMLVDQAAVWRPKADSERFDGVADNVASLFNSVRLAITGNFNDFIINKMVQDMALKVSTWNKTQVMEAFRRSLGIDLFGGEPYLQEELTIWSTNNVNLVKDVSAQFIRQSEQIVLNGLQKGIRHEAIAKQILNGTDLEKGRFKTAKTRAEMIGRDQVSKLNGTLNRYRQTGAGVKRFIWRTVGDGRVRDSHAYLNTKEFTWADGAGGLYPGDDYNCRCFAEPIFDDLFAQE